MLEKRKREGEGGGMVLLGRGGERRRGREVTVVCVNRQRRARPGISHLGSELRSKENTIGVTTAGASCAYCCWTV